MVEGKCMNRIKKIIKLFIPPIFLKIRELLKGKSFKGFYSDIFDVRKTSDKLFILGNGPSLKMSLQKYMSYFISGDYDVLVVNNILYDDVYEKLKPKFHMYMDPSLFTSLELKSNELRLDSEKFVSTLVRKVTWEMYFIVSCAQKDSWIFNRISENPYIRVVFINNKDYVSYKTESEKFHLWDENLLSVPAQTVLNTALYYGIAKRYTDIYLFGADTNWIEQVKVDQETNQVYEIDEHFYGRVIRPIFTDLEEKVPVKMYEQLDSISCALKLYWDLRSYSEYAGVKVYNASEYSLIDAFERKKL